MTSLVTSPERGSVHNAIVDGDLLFTADDFREIAAILHGDSGISLNESKAALVYSRLAKRLRALGMESFRQYCALLGDSNAGDERQKFVAALTTNVTSFYREKHHFEHLRTRVLPKLLEAARKGGRVRLWSAACSSGEEAYSMAFTILSLLPNAADFDIRILASDIDPNVIAEAERGVYTLDAVRSIPDGVRQAALSTTQDNGELAWTVRESARQLIAFRELNLVGNWPMKGKFDVIFCRNVVIYFEEETQDRIWSRFAQRLNTDGYLYIGHSERLRGAAEPRFQNDGLTTYQLRERRQ